MPCGRSRPFGAKTKLGNMHDFLDKSRLSACGSGGALCAWWAIKYCGSVSALLRPCLWNSSGPVCFAHSQEHEGGPFWAPKVGGRAISGLPFRCFMHCARIGRNSDAPADGNGNPPLLRIGGLPQICPMGTKGAQPMAIGSYRRSTPAHSGPRRRRIGPMTTTRT
jgi:hypothetical protein